MHQQSCALRNNIQIYEKCNKRSFENSSARLWVIMNFYHLPSTDSFWRQWWWCWWWKCGCFMFLSSCYYVVALCTITSVFFYSSRFPRTIKNYSRKICSSISCEILTFEKLIKNLSTWNKNIKKSSSRLKNYNIIFLLNCTDNLLSCQKVVLEAKRERWRALKTFHFN